MKSIKRTELLKEIKKSLKNFKVTALIGPRQTGKTTIVKDLIKNLKNRETHFFDLEDPTDFDLLENAKLTLGPLEGFIVIDEIQERPELFKYLRVKSDVMKKSSRVIILGSSTKNLVEGASESLAGRINYIEIPGFSISEVKDKNTLFLRGGYPLSFLARNQNASKDWRRAYIQAYIGRDLKRLGIDLPPQSIRRFLEMLCGYHGQIVNFLDIGTSMGFSHTTARKYIDILISSFILRELKPWNEKIIQRQVKQPKIFFKDIGIINFLLGIEDQAGLHRNRLVGALWEGFALEEFVKINKINSDEIYFWALHQSGELDLFWKSGEKRIGIEFKYSDSPEVTSSMKKAIEFLKLDHLYIVYPGTKSCRLQEKVTLLPLEKTMIDF